MEFYEGYPKEQKLLFLFSIFNALIIDLSDLQPFCIHFFGISFCFSLLFLLILQLLKLLGIFVMRKINHILFLQLLKRMQHELLGQLRRLCRNLFIRLQGKEYILEEGMTAVEGKCVYCQLFLGKDESDSGTVDYQHCRGEIEDDLVVLARFELLGGAVEAIDGVSVS